MTGRQIDTSKEIRLWITQIVIPISIGAVLFYKNNDTFRNKINNLFKKKQNKYIVNHDVFALKTFCIMKIYEKGGTIMSKKAIWLIIAIVILVWPSVILYGIANIYWIIVAVLVYKLVKEIIRMIKDKDGR